MPPTLANPPAAVKPSVLRLDTLDDRREIHRLLDRLPPGRRLAFLQWCCRQVPHPVNVAHRSTGSTFEVFFDLWKLGHQYELDMDAAARRLESLVRRGA